MQYSRITELNCHDCRHCDHNHVTLQLILSNYYLQSKYPVCTHIHTYTHNRPMLPSLSHTYTHQTCMHAFIALLSHSLALYSPFPFFFFQRRRDATMIAATTPATASTLTMTPAAIATSCPSFWTEGGRGAATVELGVATVAVGVVAVAVGVATVAVGVVAVAVGVVAVRVGLAVVGAAVVELQGSNSQA